MKTRYRFSHRGGDRYYWESTTRIGPHDSRHEQVSVPVDWFWRPAGRRQTTVIVPLDELLDTRQG